VPVQELSAQVEKLGLILGNLRPIAIALMAVIAANIALILIVCASCVPSDQED